MAKTRRLEVPADRARARAAAERPVVVSALEDPEVFASIDHLPFMGGGADVSLAIEQRFPRMTASRSASSATTANCRSVWTHGRSTSRCSLLGTVNGRVKILESYLAPTSFALDGTQVRKGTWLHAVRVLDDDLWGQIKSGELTGLSIGGSAVRYPERVIPSAASNYRIARSSWISQEERCARACRT